MLSQKTIDSLKSALVKMGIEIPVKQIETPTKLEDVTLKDGTILSVDTMEVGSPATFTGADGVAIPADGGFELEDGSTIVCVAGLVTEIKPKAEEPVAPAEDMAAILSRLTAIESKYAVSLESNKSLETQLSESKKGIAIALSSIEEMNTKAVAISLTVNTPKVKKAISEMSELEIYREFKSKK